jgi:hypothetical protein
VELFLDLRTKVQSKMTTSSRFNLTIIRGRLETVLFINCHFHHGLSGAKFAHTE